ncbi:MAG: hypothetical protein MUO18_07130, partial [Methanomassiliicoccales archaeon]|nr:hypothetical protein [Methanomassiliicoccales archaeon]
QVRPPKSYQPCAIRFLAHPKIEIPYLTYLIQVASRERTNSLWQLSFTDILGDRHGQGGMNKEKEKGLLDAQISIPI